MSISMVSSIVGMLITLAFAYGIDRWLFLQKRYALQYGNFSPWSNWEILSGLLLCAVWFGLSWIFLAKGHRSLVISIIFILIGLSAFVISPLARAYPSLGAFWYTLSTNVYFLQLSGLFVAVLGLFSLLPQKHNPAG